MAKSWALESGRASVATVDGSSPSNIAAFQSVAPGGRSWHNPPSRILDVLQVFRNPNCPSTFPLKSRGSRASQRYEPVTNQPSVAVQIRPCGASQRRGLTLSTEYGVQVHTRSAPSIAVYSQHELGKSTLLFSEIVIVIDKPQTPNTQVCVNSALNPLYSKPPEPVRPNNVDPHTTPKLSKARWASLRTTEHI